MHTGGAIETDDSTDLHWSKVASELSPSSLAGDSETRPRPVPDGGAAGAQRRLPLPASHAAGAARPYR